MALSDKEISALYFEALGSQHLREQDRKMVTRFARAIESEVLNSALEEAATAVESATYRKRWARAAVNGQANNVPPCELAALIRAMKETIQ